MPSPTQRTIKYFNAHGWQIGIVERFNPHVGEYGIRQDLFGFVDLVAFKGEQVLFVQATSSGVASRIDKILDNEIAHAWLDGGHYIHVIGWRELAAYKIDGTRAKRGTWTPRNVLLWKENGNLERAETDTLLEDW